VVACRRAARESAAAEILQRQDVEGTVGRSLRNNRRVLQGGKGRLTGRIGFYRAEDGEPPIVKGSQGAGVVCQVEEELAGGTVRIARLLRHGQGAERVRYAADELVL